MLKLQTTLIHGVLRCLVIVTAGLVLFGCAGLATRVPEKGPFLRLSNGQPASFVIGQQSLTATEIGNERFMDHWCSPSFFDGKLIIPDNRANRFWVFSRVPKSDVVTPDALIGQKALADGNGGANPFDKPTGIQKQGGHYYVSTHAGVISIWEKLPVGIQAYDDKALITRGEQPVWGMWGLTTARGKLIASSRGHVYIWNIAPTSSTTLDSADIILTSAGGMGAPFIGSNHHWTDGEKLIVTDMFNHRVLVWNTFPISSADPPDFVLGQTDMTCPEGLCRPGTSAMRLDGPTGVTSNGIQIFVSDRGNSRVLVWNSFPTANNTPADVVLGQADFTSNLPLRGGTAVTAETLGDCSGIGFGDHKLIVGDSADLPDGSRLDRWLVFESK